MVIDFWWMRSKGQREEISAALEKVLNGDFSQRLEGHYPRHLANLSILFNQLVEKMQILEKQSHQLEAILRSMAEGVIAVDKETRIISINPSIAKMFNLDKKSAEGVFFLEAIRNSDLFELMSVSLKEASFVSKEIVLEWPVQRVLKINTSPIFEKEEVNGCLMVIHDITEIKRLERMRSDFVANVSHELKTPLTSIKGFVETLLEEAFEDRENSINFLKIIHEHTNRINRIINDLLDLSSFESKTISLEKETFPLKSFVEEIISGLRAQLREKKVKVEVNIALNLNINADKDKLRQVLVNLLSNAIKFNKENGEIKIYAEPDKEFTKITVEDSGIGIPEKDIPRIFERFYRVDKARSRQLGGTGLGLSIVKHITELHGGKVGVESTEGLGSKFWFTLPK